MDYFLDPRYSTDTEQVFINKIGATSAAELRIAEAASRLRLSQLTTRRVNLPGELDAAHLKAIHKHLFGDVFQWAGHTRAWGQFQGVKQQSGYEMHYAPYRQLDTRLDAIGGQLQQENFLRGLPAERFADRLAYYADQYNYTHAFREGNGRTIQAVLGEISHRAGYVLTLGPDVFQGGDNNAYNLARNEAINRPDPNVALNLVPLADLLRANLTPAAGAEAAQLRHPDQARPLREPTPAMQHMEALRTLAMAGENLTDNIKLAHLAAQKFSPAAIDEANEKAESWSTRILHVVHEPSSWLQNRKPLLELATDLAQQPNPLLDARELTVQRQNLSKFAQAVLLLENNKTLNQAFRESEVTRQQAQLAQVGLSRKELWQSGQMEKLLKGEVTAPLTLTLPTATGKMTASMTLQLVREEGKVGIEFRVPPGAQAQQQRLPGRPTESPKPTELPKPTIKPPKRRGPKL